LKSHSAASTETLRRQLLAAPEVLECVSLSGDADLLLKVVAPDLDTYHQLISRLVLQHECVATVRSMITLATHKSTTALPTHYAD
jgi:DNA-binding Lrp family transcriptional regulator